MIEPDRPDRPDRGGRSTYIAQIVKLIPPFFLIEPVQVDITKIRSGRSASCPITGRRARRAKKKKKNSRRNCCSTFENVLSNSRNMLFSLIRGRHQENGVLSIILAVGQSRRQTLASIISRSSCSKDTSARSQPRNKRPVAGSNSIPIRTWTSLLTDNLLMRPTRAMSRKTPVFGLSM